MFYIVVAPSTSAAHVYAVGNTDTGSLRAVLHYTVATDTWVQLTDLPYDIKMNYGMNGMWIGSDE